MSYFDRLKNNQKRFLRNLGIYSDADMPTEFFGKIKSLNEDLTSEEIYCVSDYYKPYCYNGKLDMSKLVGTDHDKYVGKSWIEAFCELSRGEDIAELYFQNPDYYKNDDPNEIDMGIIEKDGQYYISSKAGGGNNRLITLKLLAIMQQRAGQDIISPLVRFRRVPTMETCKNIFGVEFVDGQLTKASRYQIEKTDPDKPEEYYNVVEGLLWSGKVIAEHIPGSALLQTVFPKNSNDSYSFPIR